MLSFLKFQKEIELFGPLNTLAATALKLRGPGIIDVYKECENWRFTLVDPDNRTPVRYPKSPKKQIKAQLHERALNFRKEYKALFLEGKYIPLEVKGSAKDHVVAYLHTHKGESCLVAAVRHFANLKSLKNIYIQLPQKIDRGMDLFSGAVMESESELLTAESLFLENSFVWITY